MGRQDSFGWKMRERQILRLRRPDVGAWFSWRRGEDRVGDACGFNSGADGVGADDGCAVEDGGDESGDGGGFARGEGGRLAVVERGERKAEEGFAAQSGEEGATQCEEFILARKEGEVFGEALAEAVAGV